MNAKINVELEIDKLNRTMYKYTRNLICIHHPAIVR